MALGWIKSLLGTGATRPTSVPQIGQGYRVGFRAGYDAARVTDANRKHWAHTDAFSATAAHQPSVRKVLRERARHEVANNPHARAMVGNYANFIVGTCPRLQMLAEDSEVNSAIEAAFLVWASQVRLGQKLRTARVAQAETGEVFIRLVTNDRLPGAVKLDLQLIEADRIAGELNDSQDDGIEYDAVGNPTFYRVLRRHPGDNTYSPYMGDYERVSAGQIIHLFSADRPGQTRGVPEIVSALSLFAQIRDYRQAVLDAAQLAAVQSFFMKTNSPAADPARLPADAPTVELSRNEAPFLPEGWEPFQLKSEQPTTSYAEYNRTLLTEAGRSLMMPSNLATGDSSQHNFASGRLDHQQFFRHIEIQQDNLVGACLDRVFAAWFAEAQRISGLLPQPARRANVDTSHQWNFDGQKFAINPAQEASAIETNLRTNSTTLAIEYAKQGRDWETEIRQRAKEKALVRELGMTEEEAAPVPVATDDDDEPQPARRQEARRGS